MGVTVQSSAATRRLSSALCADARSQRQELHTSAVSLLSSLKYRNAGTVLYDVDRECFYFIEVNAHPEHPVSEQVTGCDLVQTQFRIAGGETGALPRQFRFD